VSLASLWRFLAVALPVLGALIAPLPSVDLAYHLRAGGQILDGHGIPSVDTWTFTIANVSWLDQQWGAQVILAAAYRVAGWTGLVVLRAALVGLAFWLLLLTVERRAPRLPSRWAALLVLAAFLVSALALALRPQLIAIVLFAATLFILASRDAHPRWIWFIPFIAAAWANVHGSFPLVLVLVAIALFADVLDRRSRNLKRPFEMLIVGGYAGLATLVNPFGLDVWRYVIDLARNPTITSRVSEWQPTFPNTIPGVLFWASVVGVGALVVRRLRRRAPGAGIPWPALLTVVGFAALGAYTGRGLAWWPIAAVFVVAPWLQTSESVGFDPAIASALREPTLARRMERTNLAIVAALITVGILTLPLWRNNGLANAPLGVVTYAPQDLTRALDSAMGFDRLGAAQLYVQQYEGLPRMSTAATADPAGLRYRTWNPQRWGSWLEFAVPDATYALDSRIELFPPSVWVDADTVASGTGAWESVLLRYKVRWVVTDPASDGALERALAGTSNWVRLYWGCEGSIWLWNGDLERAKFGPPGDTKPLCP
jgi:hypothetical protein